jgi:hypothetical protein
MLILAITIAVLVVVLQLMSWGQQNPVRSFRILVLSLALTLAAAAIVMWRFEDIAAVMTVWPILIVGWVLVCINQWKRMRRQGFPG